MAAQGRGRATTAKGLVTARLFLWPRTVAGHLSNALPKQNVTSRAGLRDALTGLAAPQRTA
ncbi:hypothetical protein [Streptomyces sp. NPDC002763]|uniref:hypothetical protein n=1 Tax=Streptomyces sp. NPDC002763 TaxID=3154427 RepID=UPI0033308DDA